MDEVSDRKRREQDFHDSRFADDRERQDMVGRFYRIADSAKLQYQNSVLKDTDRTDVLEYGCGTGSLAFDLSEVESRNVVGIDISPVAIETARAEAARLGSPTNLKFEQMDAENLQFPDEGFDLICGSGILHHLDIDKALSSISRTLRPKGKAVFLEPLGHNVFINLYRYFTPSIRSADEHPLKSNDIKKMKACFDQVNTEYFNLTSLAAGLYGDRPGSAGLLKVLESLDSMLLKIPVVKFQAWFVVIELHKK